MELKIAKTAGFCFGVSRAMELVERLSGEGEKVSTLGPIIHNPQAVEALEKKGVKAVKSLDECDGGATVVIRSHGVAERVYGEIKARGLKFADATCPFVEKIHKIVRNASEKGNVILIAGDKNHPEVEGIMGLWQKLPFLFLTARKSLMKY